MKSKLTSAVLVTVCSALLPLISQAQTLLSDTFALNGDDRVPGASLTGTAPETGTGVYNSVYGPPPATSALFGASGGLVLSGGDINAYDFISAPSGPLTTSLTINFGGVSTGFDYIFLAFGQGGSPYGIGGYLANDGSVTLFNAAISAVGSGNVAGFSLGSTYTLTLNYDQTTQIASMYVNGNQIVGPTNLGTGFAATPILGDFFGTSLANTPNVLVSGYSVSVGTAVPEPSSTALFVAGGLFMIFCVQRRRKLAPSC